MEQSLSFVKNTNNSIDTSKTTAHPIWQNSERKEITWLFDPWSSRDQAYVTHGHHHTTWVPNAEDAFEKHKFHQPATFDWRDQRIIIVGRGASLARNVKFLNKRRKEVAIFLNTAYNPPIKPQPQDFVFMMDNRILAQDNYMGPNPNISLLSFPGIDPEIRDGNWKDVYGFVFWTNAPLNNWMRKKFPHLPEINDCLACIIACTNLAAINGAKEIVYVGADFSNEPTIPKNEEIIVRGIDGNPCATQVSYGSIANGTTFMAFFANHHLGTKFINASGSGVLGLNLLELANPKLVPWFKVKSLKRVLNGKKGVHGTG